ncbi:MAG: hypothetical protein V5A43_09185 [Haloarculaceae archaeon]
MDETNHGETNHGETHHDETNHGETHHDGVQAHEVLAGMLETVARPRSSMSTDDRWPKTAGRCDCNGLSRRAADRRTESVRRRFRLDDVCEFLLL